MTGPGVNPAAPEVSVAPLISCGAGLGTTIEVYVRHPGPLPATMTVAVHGLDPGWVPGPMIIGPLQPGEVTRIEIAVRPEPGALGARYPFVVAVESLEALGRTGPVTSSAESTLAVDSRERAAVLIDPVQVTAIFGKKIRLQITNPAQQDRTLELRPTAPQGISVRLAHGLVDVPAGRTVTVPGRVRVRHPRVFGTSQVHTYAIAVRGQGAPVVVDGTARARALFRGALVKAVAAVVVIALWAGLAIVAIPRITSYLTSDSSASATANGGAATGPAGAAPPGGGAPRDGTSGGGDGSSGGGAAGDGSAGGGPDAGGAGAAPAPGERLRGIVTGADPAGVTVILAPTSLVEAAAAGAQPAAGVTDGATASGLRAARETFGKTPSTALRLAAPGDPPTVSTDTATDGTFSLAGIRSPGFYLLTFARAGYQTQRFIVNSATLGGADPLKVALVAGEGSLSGVVNSAAGPVGAATVTITDGRVSLQTSTVSAGGDGTPGSWSVTGLSTPGSYLVSAASPGLGTASSLVSVDAGGTATADLTMLAGVAAVTGQVSGVDQLGQLGGIGGVSVAITGQSGDVTTTRTATTVTSGPVGRFTLPDLPTPGDYTLTVSGAGYQDQVRQISLAAGAGAVDLDISLTRADGVVSGTVTGSPTEGGLVGAGLTLTGPQGSIKTMTTSDPPGSFRFTGVPPGVYVLAGSMFGRVPSSVTVEVTAAGDVNANLTLLSAADTELPATARIKGRAVDARTGATLTCDRSANPGETCLLTASVPVPAFDPVTGRIDPTAPPQIVSGTFSPAEDYLLPSTDDTAHPGLVPGLYTVTLTAPGYEPTSTSVQVAQGQVVPAAQVSLSPLGILTGRITTRVGTPVGTTCVAVTPAGAPVVPAGAVCTPNPDGVTCTVGTDPSIHCGLVQADATYQVRGLVHGGYTAVVLISDREYIPPAPFNVQLDLGADAQYDPVLDRLGRFSVTVLTPNDVTAELTPVAGATVTASDASGPRPPATSGADGVALLTGLVGTFSLAAAGSAGSAALTAVAVQLNQTVDLTMVLTAPIGSVVGRIVTNDGGTAPVGVVGVTVRVTGLIGFSGATPVTGFAEPTTDAQGCFVILPTLQTAPPTGTVNTCTFPLTDPAASSTINTAGGFLIARPVSVFVPETSKTQGPLTANLAIEGSTDIKTLPVVSVLPKPSPTTGLTLTSNPTTGPPTPLRAAASIVVLTKPPGAGSVGIIENVTPAGASTLTWTDPAVGGTNLAAPGNYTLQASLLGWETATATVNCPLGAPCVFVTPFTLVRNPTFVGTVTVLPTTDGTSPALATYSVLSGPTPLPVISLTANAAGVLTWQEAGAPTNLIRPGTYRIAATLGGFESQPLEFTCGAGPGNCPLPAPLSLRRLAQPTLQLFSTGAVPPVGATVRLTGDSIGEQNLAAPANSTAVALPSLSTFDQSYAVQVRAAGFQTLTVPLSAANCTGPPGSPRVPGVVQPGVNICRLTLTQLGRIPVRTFQTSPNTATAALSSVAVAAQQLSSDAPDATNVADPFAITTAGDGTGVITGSISREGLVDGTYRITATKAGYQDATGVVQIVGRTLVSAPPSGFLIDGNGNLTIVLQVKPVTLVVRLLNNNVPVLPAATITLRGNNITRTCTLVTTGGTAACVPADADTTVVNGANAEVEFGNLFPAVYSVTFTSTDNRYRTQSVQTQLNAIDINPPVVMILDLRASLQTGVVFDPAGKLVSGAAVSMRPDANVEAPANDIDGAPLVATSDGSGQFSFAKVPDGLYRVMVDAPGWNRIFSATTITMNSALTTTPPSLTLRLTTRQSRAVTATLTSTAGAVDLGGAAVTFRPVGGTQPAGTPANVPLSGFTVSATSPFVVSAPQVPTGQWTLAVTPGGGAAFGPFETASFDVPAPDRGIPTLPPNTIPTSPDVAVTQTLQQGQATISVSWPAGCSAPPASGTLPITLTHDGTSVPLSAAITGGANAGDAGSATVLVALPPGDYTWAANPTAASWTGGTGSFTVPATGAPPRTVTSIGTLVAPQVPVTTSVTVDGTARSGQAVAAIPPGDGAPISGTTGAPFCLAPGAGWTFSVRDPANPLLLIPDRTGVTITRAGPNTVAFVGFTFRPSVALQAIAGRTPDAIARPVALSLALPAGEVWSGTVTIPAGGTSADGPALIIGPGSYSLTATPSGTGFGPVTRSGIDPSATPAVTVTVPYTAVLLTVTVTTAGVGTQGAVVTLTPAAGTGSPQTTGATGVATFRDIPAGTYTVTATVTVGGTVTARGELTGQVFAAGATPSLTVPLVAVP